VAAGPRDRRRSSGATRAFRLAGRGRGPPEFAF
jgi:hypothetical protein